MNVDTGEFRALGAAVYRLRKADHEPEGWIHARRRANELSDRLEQMMSTGQLAAEGTAEWMALVRLADEFHFFTKLALRELSLNEADLNNACSEVWLDAYASGFREGRAGRHARPRGGRHERGHLRLVAEGRP
ncbi:MAG: hypothetical protein ACRDPY_42250 [Streptosporangiaceae bacterium]